MRPFFYFAVFSISFSFFMDGFDIPLLNRPQMYINRLYNKTYSEGNYVLDLNQEVHWGLVAAFRTAGNFVGVGISSPIVQRIGRKHTLMFNTVFSILGGLCGTASLSHYFTSTDLLAFARFLSGIHMGITITVVPVYLNEISPIAVRGATGSVPEFTLTFRLILTMVLCLPGILDKYNEWYHFYGFLIIWGFLKVLMLFFTPESPKYLLINKQNEEKCRKVLSKLHKQENIEEAISELKSGSEEIAQVHVRYIDFITHPHFWKLLLIACILQSIQILSGIVPMNYFSNIVFTRAGFSETVASYTTLGIHLVFIFGVVLTIRYIDHYGRRATLLFGLTGVIISHVMLSIGLIYGGKGTGNISWADICAIIACVMFMFFSAIGPVSIPWFTTGELFPHHFVPKAITITMVLNRTLQAIQSLLFPMTNRICGEYTFLIYTGVCILQWFFVWFCLPETKNKTFDQVYRQVSRKMFFCQNHSTVNPAFELT